MVYETSYNSKFPESSIFKYPNIFDAYVIADTHFYHNSIDTIYDRPHNWKDKVINNWNGIVNGKDTVIHLGDFSYGSKTTVFNLTNQLPGNLYLVRGNHDTKDKDWYDDCRISLLESFLVKNGKFKFLFTHRPARYVPADTINIHGHLHNKCPLFWQNGTGSKHINVSVEAVRYRPVKLGEIIEMSGFLN